MIELIGRDIYKTSQSVCLTSYHDVADGNRKYRIKISIERDSIYDQSHARSYVWADVGWEFVCFIPVDFLNLKNVAIYFGSLKDVEQPLLATEKDLLDRTISIVL